MITWTPPRGCKALLSIDTLAQAYHPSIKPKDGITVAAQERLLRTMHQRLGLKYTRHGHQRLGLDDRRWPAILAALDAQAPGQACRIRACWLEEPAPPADENAWYRLSCGAGEFPGPARAPSGRHLMWSAGVYFASDALRACVRTHRLTGLEFLPPPAPLRPGPLPWFQVFATDPIGRGLDHPLLDAPAHEAELKKEKFDPARRWGQAVVQLNEIRDDAKIAHPLVALFIQRRLPCFRVAGGERFVREFLPPTDFAYEGWGFKLDLGPGAAGRPVRSLVCNDRARRALLESGVMKQAWFEARATVPEAQAAPSIVLDRAVPHPLPLPIYTPAELTVERARREALHGAARQPGPPPAFKTTAAAVAALRQWASADRAAWKPAQESRKFARVRASALYKQTPAAWQRLAPFLPLSVESTVDGEPFAFQMVPPEWNDWLSDNNDERPAAEKPSARDMVIARTPFGDWFAVRLRTGQAPTDARITLWDHETLSAREQWPSVRAFAAFLSAVASAPVT